MRERVREAEAADHGGTLTIKSTLGLGTNVELWFFDSTGNALQNVDFTSPYVFNRAGGITSGGGGNFSTAEAVSPSLAIGGTTFNFPIGSNPSLTLLAREDKLISRVGGVDTFLETSSGATFKNYLFSTDFPSSRILALHSPITSRPSRLLIRLAI